MCRMPQVYARAVFRRGFDWLPCVFHKSIYPSQLLQPSIFGRVRPCPVPCDPSCQAIANVLLYCCSFYYFRYTLICILVTHGIGASTIVSTFTSASPSSVPSSFRNASRLKSTTRCCLTSRCAGPRSITVTMTELPLCSSVTRRRVPIGWNHEAQTS